MIAAFFVYFFLMGLNLHISQRSSRGAGKGCGYEARAEKLPQAYPEPALTFSTLRMFFERNETDAMLTSYTAGRKKNSLSVQYAG